MKKSILIAAVAVLGLTVTTASAQTDTTKKSNLPTTQKPSTADTATAAGDVIGALNSNTDYTSAAQAVKAANLEATLKTGGPYTIFAPHNNAFGKLPAGKLDSLMKDPEKLAILLKGHVVSGKYGKADIIKALSAGKGKATLTTLNGQTLTLGVSPKKTLQLTDTAGNTAEVVLYDLVGANGIVNGLDNILTSSK